MSKKETLAAVYPATLFLYLHQPSGTLLQFFWLVRLWTPLFTRETACLLHAE